MQSPVTEGASHERQPAPESGTGIALGSNVRVYSESLLRSSMVLLAVVLNLSEARAWCIGAPAIDGVPVVDPVLDDDGDGLNNLQEALVGTDPENPDTDGDGTSDSEQRLEGVRHLDRPSLFSIERFADPRLPEARQALVLEGTNLFRRGRRFNAGRRNGFAEVMVEETGARRLVFDTDRDGVSDGVERRVDLDPNDPDSDDDGMRSAGCAAAKWSRFATPLAAPRRASGGAGWASSPGS